jgi:hypothetical protein
MRFLLPLLSAASDAHQIRPRRHTHRRVAMLYGVLCPVRPRKKLPTPAAVSDSAPSGSRSGTPSSTGRAELGLSIRGGLSPWVLLPPGAQAS